MRGDRFLYVLVFVVGMGSLGAEIAVARLMAPFFGASTIVWANTIGVVLVALSIGYWFGGRLADRHPHLRGLCLLVMAAAVLLALVPFAADPFFEGAVDALDEISAGAFVGSLLAVLVLIAVPVVLMGACAPWAVRLATPDVEHAGRTTGRLYAVSTAGSLAGTMLSSLVLIPFLGTQRTFIAFALALGLVAAAGLGWRYLAAPVALAGAIAIPVGTVKATTEAGDRVIYEDETETQYLRVIEERDGDRRLELNEGIAQHSFYSPRSYITHGYWDGLLVLPFLNRSTPPERVAVLGNAAGTAARGYGHYFPQTKIDGVEIDPELEQVGRRFFDMTNPNLTVHNEDARPWLRASDGDYDVIIVDTYRQPYLPFYMATREFFELARDRLAPGGMVIVNVGHIEGSDDLEKVVSATMAEVFPALLRDPLEDTSTLLVGSDTPLSAEGLRRVRNGLPTELQQRADLELARLGPPLEGGDVYTDDEAPVEWLIDRSIIGYAAGD
ncbi:MAG TPA: fused MFS/spermidine synthase [Solirubrobacterales bacterium]|jgi:predicted membrane-bound spermidine synthase|nr:fused MFS/spermidine synthase [Solirubrobacterales bacterium]